MNRAHVIRDRSGLSFPAIIAAGLIAGLFLCIGVFAAQYVHRRWSPTRKNVDRLLVQRKYDDALALVETKRGAFGDSGAMEVMAGKIWLAIAWERMNLDKWKSYGKNPADWFDLPEASKAESYLRAAIERGPSNAEAHHYMGVLYMEKGWFSMAEMEFIEALKICPADVRTKQNLAVLYAKMGRTEEAKQELLAAHRLEPDNASIMKNLALLYRIYLDQPESSMVWANRYLNTEPHTDLDMNVIREEFNTMAERYPELVPDEPLRWKKDQRFPQRWQSAAKQGSGPARQ